MGQYLLALRLRPELTEPEIVSLLLESLRPSIRKILRAANLETFEDLFERATQAEADEAEEGLSKETGKRKTAPVAPAPLVTAETPATTSRPRSPCHHCGGWHFHRDCPVLHSRRSENVPENWRARAVETNVLPAPVAPGAPQS